MNNKADWDLERVNCDNFAMLLKGWVISQIANGAKMFKIGLKIWRSNLSPNIPQLFSFYRITPYNIYPNFSFHLSRMLIKTEAKIIAVKVAFQPVFN